MFKETFSNVAKVLIFLVAIVWIISSIVTGSIYSLFYGIRSIFTVPPDSASVVATQTIVTGIQSMGQLVSISAQLAKADIGVSVERGAMNVCGFSANHVAQGTVEAGINLAAITEGNIQHDETTNTYHITLPAAQLTSCRVDFIRQYDRSTTACVTDWDEARLLANYLTLVEFRNDSLEGGITTRAEREAREVLSRFVNLLTASAVEIVFEPTNDTLIPPSCAPDIPQGWSYNEEAKRWVKE